MRDVVGLGDPPMSQSTAPASVRSRVTSVVFRPLIVVIVGLSVGALIPLSWLTSGPSFCPFKLFTGLPCPGCGITRATVAFLHGDFGTSFYFHPLAGPMVVVLVAVAIVDAWVWWRSQQPGQTPLPSTWLIERLGRSPAPWIAVGALVVVWLVRLPLYVLGVWTF